MKRPLILAAVVALAIGLLTLGGAAIRDAAPSTHAQGAATPTASPSPSPSPAASPVASPTTTTASSASGCTATTLGEPRRATGATSDTALARDCDTLLGLRYTLSTPATLNWSASVPLTRWNGVTVTPATPARVVNGVTIATKPARVTGLELKPYAFWHALAELATLDALVDLDLAVHTTRDTTETPDTGTTGPTPQTTLRANPPTCSDKALGGRGQRAANPQLAADCDTLLKIKSTLAQKDPNAPGDPATRPDPLSIWGHDTALSDWGNTVTVSGTPKRVTELRLRSLGLKGIIPTQIGDLTALEILDLRDNQLTGSIPTQIENLTALTALQLSGNQLTGSIPTQIEYLTALTKLHLRDNQLDGSIPTQIGELKQLRSFTLWGNRVTGVIPTQIGELKELRHLKIAGNQLTGSIPTQLGKLLHLTTLTLEHNRLTGYIPTQLGNLTNLKDLRMHGQSGTTKLSGSIPPQLGNLSALTRIALNGNDHTGCIPNALFGIENRSLPDLPTCPTTTN